MNARIPVPSQMNTDAWSKMTHGKDDADLADHIQFGWPMNYNSPTPPTPTHKNHATSVNEMHEIDLFIDTELNMGAMLGPFTDPPFEPWFNTTPIMTWPKKDSERLRIILDLSYPAGESVNSGISTNTQGTHRKYTLPGIDDLISEVSEVRENGAGSYMWKSDMSRAYRQLRLDPLDYPLMGIKHRNRYYIDICPSFGFRTSGSACQRTTNAIAEELRNEGFHCVVYVDDFCGAAPTRETATAAYKCLHNTAARLGVELAIEKDVPPTTCLDFLGFEVNTQSMEVKIPQKKLDEIVEECQTWRHVQRTSKKKIRSLAGKLQHVSKCIPQGRRFMCRILEALRKAADDETVRVTHEIEIEIEILLFIEWKVIQKFNRDEEVQRRTYVHPGILHIY